KRSSNCCRFSKIPRNAASSLRNCLSTACGKSLSATSLRLKRDRWGASATTPLTGAKGGPQVVRHRFVCRLVVQAALRYCSPMSTLSEIEAAADALTPEQKQELLLFLAADRASGAGSTGGGGRKESGD